MKFVLTLLLLAVLVVVGGTLYVAAHTFDDEPTLAATALPAANDLARIRQLLQQADPRNLQPGAITALSLHERDLEQAFNYALSRYSTDGRGKVDITDGVARVQASVKMPFDLLGSYVNADVSLVQGPTQLQVQHLQIGGMTVPAAFADELVLRAYDEALRRYPQYTDMVAAIDHYSIGNDEVQLTYQWQPALLDQLAEQGRDLLLSPENKERLRAHASRLAALTQLPNLPARVSMTALLGPMMQFAQQRGGTAVEENRAALQVLAMYAMQVDASPLLGEVAVVAPHELRLANRKDFAQHFLGSAGIAVTTDTALTQSIGELKEIEDTEEGGSGFSFSDLAVDRAGARVGELAVSSEANAKRLQEILSASDLQEALLMPDVEGLPEFMLAEEFRQRFVEVGSAEYGVVADDIEQRVNALPIFSQLSAPTQQ